MARMGKLESRNKETRKDFFANCMFMSLVDARSVAETECNKISQYCKFQGYILDH